MNAPREALHLGPAAPPKAARRSLWQMTAECHALLVGTCLPAAELRRVTDRLFGGRSRLDDKALAAAVAGQCATRNKVSAAVQRALDERHAAAVRRFAAADSAARLREVWHHERDGEDFVGAFWAAIGHAHGDGAWHEQLCIDLQWRLCALAWRVRDDAAELAALHAQVRHLKAEQQRTQQRHATWRDEALAARDALLADVRRLRQENVRLGALAAHWQRRAEAAAAAQAEAEAACAQLPTVPAEAVQTQPVPARPWPAAADSTAPHNDASVAPVASLTAAAAAETAPSPRVPQLDALTVLCVGGRHARVPVYRSVVERHGGLFQHHDGGIEDNLHRLDARLAAADLVVCESGHLSHNAYARVKAHCKRHATPCVYLEHAGVERFTQALALVAAPSAGAAAARA